MKIRVNHPPFRSKDELTNAIKEIGQTIIDRADDIACDPVQTMWLDIAVSIRPDEAITISWEVEVYV